MGREAGEANLPNLAGDYEVPIQRATPLWGGLSEDGFAPVHWHANKTLAQDEWAKAVREGNVAKALRFLNPDKKAGP